MNILIAILIFIIPATCGLTFPFVGSLSVGELFLIPAFAVCLTRASRVLQYRTTIVFLCLLFFYLLSLIASDIYRENEVFDAARGWAKVLTTSVSFIVAAALIGNSEKRFILFFLGYMCMTPISWLTPAVTFDEQDAANLFKFGVGASSAMFVCLLGGTLMRGRWLPFALCLTPLAVTAVFFNCRSIAGIMLLTLFITLFLRNSRIGVFSVKTTARLAAIALCGVLIFLGYNHYAPKGILGEAAREKFYDQSSQKAFEDARKVNFDLGKGRREMHYSVPKIMQSPFIGWGSWHRDYDYVIERTLARGLSLDQAKVYATRHDGIVPSHSFFFGGWMEAGLMGGIFWGAAFILNLFLMAKAAFLTFPKLKFAVVFMMVYFSWDCIFSPYGVSNRIWVGFFLWLIVCLHERTKRGARNAARP